MSVFRAKNAAVSALALALAACSTGPTTQSPGTGQAAVELGPTKYDASGAMPCARGVPDFKKACGYRVIRKPGGEAEIWISNSKDGNPFYRVLYFAKGEFTTRDAAPVRVSKKADEWTVSVGSDEHYRFPDAVIIGG